jgi:hypothetical protein
VDRNHCNEIHYIVRILLIYKNILRDKYLHFPELMENKTKRMYIYSDIT